MSDISKPFLTDWDGPETFKFRSGWADFKDETGPTICYDKVGENTQTRFTNKNFIALMEVI